VLALLLVAVSVSLSNFAAAIGIGVAGLDARIRLRVGVIFGIFETGMPILGLALGHGLVRHLGHAGHWIGAGLLIATGAYSLIQTLRSDTRAPVAARELQTGRLLITGLALSIDNLAVGFALGTYHVSFALAAIVIGAVSVAMSLAGLELGDHIGAKMGQHGEFLGGIVLIAVGAAVGTGIL
jgi:manganese efflux pump family protein